MSLREQVRVALAARGTLPAGLAVRSPSAVLAAGRQPNRAAAVGEESDRAAAEAVVRTLAEYVAGLPLEIQQDTAKLLVALRVGPRWAEVLRREAAEVREVLGRAVEFHRQLQEATETPAVPLLVRPGHRDQQAGRCISCGARTTTFRCPLCRLAVWIALDLTPNDVAHELEW